MNSNFLLQKLSFNKIFFILFFPSLISGPLIPELLIIGLIVNFFLKNNIKSLVTKNLKLYLIFLLIFYFYININSLFFSFDTKISLKSTLPYIRLIFFSLIISKILIDDEENFISKLFIYSSFFLLTFLLIDSLIQLLTGTNIFGQAYKNGRITSLFGSEQIMGSFVVKILPIILCFLYLLNLNKKKYLGIIFLTISLILVIFSSERVALAHYILIFILILFIESKSIKNFIIYIFLLIFLIVIGLNIYTPAKERIKDATLNQIKSTTLLFAPSYRHELHYLTAIYIFLDNPIFGEGIKSFRYKCGIYENDIKNKIINDKAVYAPYNGVAKIIDIEERFYGPKKIIRFFKYNENLDKVENTIYEEYYFNNNFKKFNLKFDTKNIIKEGEFIYVSYPYKNGCNTHPHNYLIQFLAEIGIVGFLFYLVFFLYLLVIIFKTLIIKKKQIKILNFQKSKFIICGSILVELFPLIPSGNFFNNWLSMLFFFKIGILFFLAQNQYNKK